MSTTTSDNGYIRLSKLTDAELAPVDTAIHDLANRLAPELYDGERAQAAWAAIDAAHKALAENLPIGN